MIYRVVNVQTDEVAAVFANAAQLDIAKKLADKLHEDTGDQWHVEEIKVVQHESPEKKP